VVFCSQDPGRSVGDENGRGMLKFQEWKDAQHSMKILYPTAGVAGPVVASITVIIFWRSRKVS
jgi:hypothetical protein